MRLISLRGNFVSVSLYIYFIAFPLRQSLVTLTSKVSLI